MKPSDELKKLYPITTDENAQSIAEMEKETGLSEATIRRHIKKMLDVGEWEEVLKKQNGTIAKAYKRVKP